MLPELGVMYLLCTNLGNTTMIPMITLCTLTWQQKTAECPPPESCPPQKGQSCKHRLTPPDDHQQMSGTQSGGKPGQRGVWSSHELLSHLLRLHHSGLTLRHQHVVHIHNVLIGVQVLAPLLTIHVLGLAVEFLHHPLPSLQAKHGPVVQQAVEHGNGATGIVQVALQLSQVIRLVPNLILLDLCKLLGLATITGLGGEEQYQRHHWLGDQGKQVRVQAPDINNLYNRKNCYNLSSQ
jgi:hypothetical protein